MEDKIRCHEDGIHGGRPLESLIRATARRNHVPIRGKVESPVGAIKPHVRGGQWMVLCPTCPSTTIVSLVDAVFVCADCGSPENGGQWYTVVFPRNRAAIERELLKRPAGRMLIANLPVSARAYNPGESVATLRKQRLEMFPEQVA